MSEINRRPNLVLLTYTGVSSCMMVFIPEQVQKHCLRNSTKVSDSDLENISELIHQIKEGIHHAGEFYVHGFPTKSVPMMISLRRTNRSTSSES